MESLSKERNLLLGLFLGIALAFATLQPIFGPQELVASTGEAEAMDCNGFVHLTNEWLKMGQIEMVCR